MSNETRRYIDESHGEYCARIIAPYVGARYNSLPVLELLNATDWEGHWPECDASGRLTGYVVDCDNEICYCNVDDLAMILAENLREDQEYDGEYAHLHLPPVTQDNTALVAHSPEPWEIRNSPSMRTIGQVGGDDIALLMHPDGPGHPNARRIVAAVNAVAGIPTEALEAGAVAEAMNTLRMLARTAPIQYAEAARAALARLEATHD